MAQKDVLKSLNNSKFPDNDDGLIAPADLREFNTQVIDFIPETAGGDLIGVYPNPTVGLKKIKGEQIADKTINQGNMADGSIGPSQIEIGGVTQNNLADSSVTPSKLNHDLYKRVKYREFTAMLRPSTVASISDWLLEVSEPGVITGRDDTMAALGKYFTLDLIITPGIWAKIVKSSLQVSGVGVWQSSFEIRHYTNHNDPAEKNHIQIRQMTADTGAVSTQDRIYIRFLIEN